MADKHDRLRHRRVAQHTSVQREKSQQVSEAPGPSGHAESYTSEAHASPHATPSSSSHGRRNSPTNASLPPSFCRSQVPPIQASEIPDSPMSPPTVDNVEFVSPSTADVVNPVSPPKGDVVADIKAKAFGRGLVDLSLLPLYPNHTGRHIWD
ncbi:unnamed protein product [Lathyrus oleraceus]